MALIRCSECGHEVSDKASTCPNCGCPIEKGLVCSECGNNLNTNDEICPKCGNPIEGNVVGEAMPIVRYILFSLIIALLFGGGYFSYTYFCKSDNHTEVSAVNSDTVRSDANLTEQVDEAERAEEERKIEAARESYLEREQKKERLSSSGSNVSSGSSNQGNNEYSQYSTDEGRQAYLQVLQLQKEVRLLIDKSAPYRNIMKSETYGSYNYQTARMRNMDILNAAISKQEKAIIIARNKLHDETLIRELNGQLELLNKAKYSD